MPPTARTFLVTIAVAAGAAPPLLAGPPKPVGTWVRDADEFKVQVTVTEKTVTVRATSADGADTVTVDAEYSVTSDGVLYGVVVGADARPAGLVADGQLELVTGQPFAVRYWAGGGVMHIRDVRLLGGGRDDAKSGVGDIVRAVAGRYEASVVSAARSGRVKRAAKSAGPAPVAAPRMLPAPAPVGALPASIVAQWEKDSGGRAPREVAPAPRAR